MKTIKEFTCFGLTCLIIGFLLGGFIVMVWKDKQRFNSPEYKRYDLCTKYLELSQIYKERQKYDSSFLYLHKAVLELEIRNNKLLEKQSELIKKSL